MFMVARICNSVGGGFSLHATAVPVANISRFKARVVNRKQVDVKALRSFRHSISAVLECVNC